jgi:hypothetical protein
LTRRAFYNDSIPRFLDRDVNELLGLLARGGSFTIEPTQRDAWLEQISILREALRPYQGDAGKVYFEFAVPRVGKRIDVLLVLRHVLFVIEFKVGADRFSVADLDQVWDYALDLKNFHETSHERVIAPVLVATRAPSTPIVVGTTAHRDGVFAPIRSAVPGLGRAIAEVLAFGERSAHAPVDAGHWEGGRYCPTPTIVEAALALYGRHSVEEISRSDAGATNLTCTSEAVCRIIRSAREGAHKAICFVTGVPGAGKTLVGLNIATKHFDRAGELYSVFLSGNGPLVSVLREALARDKVRREGEQGRIVRKGEARSEVKAFLQNVHHFRDDCLDDAAAPVEHVVLFDEAQRAWNLDQTAKFMRQKKGRPDFAHSEPEFLISCMDRHRDWAVVVCLVGGGQEINTGEAGIGEWIDAVLRSFPEWHVHISPQLHDSEYGAGAVLRALEGRAGVHLHPELHLGVSMRSFRSERVSAFVKAILDLEDAQARGLHAGVVRHYPIYLTRDLSKAKAWMRAQARGTERYGVVVSSQAERLKPHAIDVRSPMDPIHWFLGPKEDVRSSYYLEDVATEFHVQGLELDWAAVVWDGDFRWSRQGWQHFSFVGDRWNRVRNAERQAYLKNAYRVLLTRARQGMVIVVPEGDPSDPTRAAEYYDPTFEYLQRVGLTEI